MHKEPCIDNTNTVQTKIPCNEFKSQVIPEIKLGENTMDDTRTNIDDFLTVRDFGGGYGGMGGGGYGGGGMGTHGANGAFGTGANAVRIDAHALYYLQSAWVVL
jgi:hypothetical protein